MAVYRDKEHKTWLVKFSYRDWQGRSRFTTKRGFKTRREATEYEHDFKASAAERSDITVNALAVKYLEDKRLHVKESTFIVTETVLRTKILPYIGHLKLTELTPIVMRNWQNEMLKLDMKPNTLSEVNRKCSTFLNYAVKFYGLAENPIRKAGRIGRTESSQNFWEIDEFKKFIAVVENPLHNLCFNLLFCSGMRIGELLALNLEDFDFRNNVIHISKNRPLVTRKITSPKTPSSNRDVEMPQNLMKQVADYVNKLYKIPSPLLQISGNSLRKALSRGAHKAAVKPIRVHDLRHSHASFLIMNGVPINAISRRLGHKSPRVTLDIYSHIYKQAGTQIAELLTKQLF